MQTRPPLRLPPEGERDLQKLKRLAIWSLITQATAALLMALVMGNSQAMKAAWIDDLLALIPPAAFLIAIRYSHRPSDQRHPYGYQRAPVISFLCASVALALFGLYLLVDSTSQLLSGEHPTIGAIEWFGHTIWLGWLMFIVLIYSTIPPMIIAHRQIPIAIRVHDKTSYVSAKMGKANWMTSIAALIGIAMVGFGYWWADSLAGAIIAVDVTLDGTRSLREAVGDLIDRCPLRIQDGQPDDLTQQLLDQLTALPWVAQASLRLREEGHFLNGEAYVVPVSDEDLTQHISHTTAMLSRHHWRIGEVVITPRSHLSE